MKNILINIKNVRQNPCCVGRLLQYISFDVCAQSGVSNMCVCATVDDGFECVNSSEDTTSTCIKNSGFLIGSKRIKGVFYSLTYDVV